jgi:hypothetical protein
MNLYKISKMQSSFLKHPVYKHDDLTKVISGSELLFYRQNNFSRARTLKTVHTSSTETQETRHLISNATVEVHARLVCYINGEILNHSHN